MTTFVYVSWCIGLTMGFCLRHLLGRHGLMRDEGELRRLALSGVPECPECGYPHWPTCKPHRAPERHPQQPYRWPATYQAAVAQGEVDPPTIGGGR